MPDQSSELQILITTKAELAGAKQLEQSLEQSIGKAKALGDSAQVTKLSAELTQVRANMAKATEANKELGKSEETTSTLAEKMEKSHRAVHEGLKEIGDVVAPGVGRSLITAFEGPLGPVVALGLGLGALIEKQKQWNEEMAQAIENGAAHDFAAGLDEVNKSALAGVSGLEAYSNHIAEIYANEKGLAEQLQVQLTLMGQIAAAREAARKAAEAEAQANLDKRRAQGRVTPEQAVVEETANAVAAAKAEAEAQHQKDQDDLAKMKAEQAKGQADQPALDKAYNDAENRVIATEAHDKRLESEFGGNDEEWEKKKEQYRKSLNLDNQAEVENKLQNAKEWSAGDPNDATVAAWQEALDKINKINAELEHGRAQYLATQSPAAIKKAQKDKDATEKAKLDADLNATGTAKIKDDIAALEAKMEGTRAAQDAELSSRIAAILDGAVAKIVAMPQGGNLNAGITAADVVERGRDPGATADEFIVRLANALGAHTQNIKAAADYLEQFKNDSAGFLEAVSRMTGQVLTANGKAITALGEQVKAAEELARQAKEGSYNH